MSNDNRNKFVTSQNVRSRSLQTLLNKIDRSLDNVIETERNKVFEIAELFNRYGIGFWEDDFVIRDIVMFDFSVKSLDAILCFDIGKKSNIPFYNIRKKFVERGINEYKALNNDLDNYDIKADYYRLVCDYFGFSTPINVPEGIYFDLYDEITSIGDSISAQEDDIYNKKNLYTIALEKENDAVIFRKINNMTDDELLSDDVPDSIDITVDKYFELLNIKDPQYSVASSGNKRARTRKLLKK